MVSPSWGCSPTSTGSERSGGTGAMSVYRGSPAAPRYEQALRVLERALMDFAGDLSTWAAAEPHSSRYVDCTLAVSSSTKQFSDSFKTMAVGAELLEKAVRSIIAREREVNTAWKQQHKAEKAEQSTQKKLDAAAAAPPDEQLRRKTAHDEAARAEASAKEALIEKDAAAIRTAASDYNKAIAEFCKVQLKQGQHLVAAFGTIDSAAQRAGAGS